LRAVASARPFYNGHHPQTGGAFMSRKPKPNPAESPNQPPQKFLEIYERILNDSWSFASRMADSIKREKKKPKKRSQDS
jgi:hypothetical protein